MAFAEITAEGLVRKSLQQIRSELRGSWMQTFGNDIDLSESSPDGHHVDLEANMVSDLVELAQAVLSAYDPNTAEDVFLDIICDYAGMSRIGAAYSKVEATFFGNSGTIVPAGTRIRAPGSTVDFATISDITIDANGSITASCVATTIGPVAVNAGAYSLLSSIPGITGVTVDSIGIIGRNQETNAEFRARRKLHVRSGMATEEAIRSYIMNTVPGVTSISVTSNRTKLIDADGREPNSYEASIQGGSDLDIARALFSCQPAGISSFGNYPPQDTHPFGWEVYDSSGRKQYLRWTRRIPLFAWFQIYITEYTEEELPEDYKSQIIEAVVEWAGTQYKLGKDVIPQRVCIPVYSVPGILNVTVRAALTENQTPPLDSAYTTQRISVDQRHVAQTDSSKIAVIMS